MQKQNDLVRKQSRRMHERVGALVLLIGTLVGTAAISHEARRTLSQLAMRPAFAVIEHSTKESETTHMPVRFDQVLRAQAVSGRK